jgi:hypothetical protein
MSDFIKLLDLLILLIYIYIYFFFNYFFKIFNSRYRYYRSCLGTL